MKEKFNLCIVCHFDGDLQSLYRITKSIPDSEMFSKFVVKNMTKEEALAAEARRKEIGSDDSLINAWKADFRNLKVGFEADVVTEMRFKNGDEVWVLLLF